jgi:hypothetical protein
MATTIPIMLPNGQKDLTRRAILGALAISMLPVARTLPSINIDLTAAEPPVHPVLALPFVRDSRDDERASGAAPRCFWSVAPSGNYRTDCGTGAHYASLAVDYMSATRSPHMRGWVVADMMALQRSHSGIEVGFASVFGRLATEAHAARLALREGGLV